MQVLTVKNQLMNSSSEIQQKKKPYLSSVTKDLKTDSFSRSKINDISFKGTEGAVKGAVAGGLVGGVLGVLAAAATGGAAIPFLLPYYGTLASAAVAGAVIGNKVTGKEPKEKNEYDD